MSMTEILMRLSKGQLDRVLTNHEYFWTLRNIWRDTDHCIDIDKSWHGIDFLFAQSVWDDPEPSKWIIFGDIPIPSFDVGYGPARYLNPSQVSLVNEYIKDISLDELKRRYDPQKFDSAGIYPNIWVRDKKNALDYLLLHYKKLVKLYQKAADAGEYVLMIIG